MEEIFLPTSGLVHIKNKLRKLENNEYLKVKDRIGSLIDKNSPGYELLTERKSEIEKEIQELRYILRNAVVVENKASV